MNHLSEITMMWSSVVRELPTWESSCISVKELHALPVVSATVRGLENLESEVLGMDRSADVIVKTLPALARLINVGLAANDVGGIDTSQLDLSPGARAAVAGLLGLIRVFLRYGTVLWLPGKTPRGVDPAVYTDPFRKSSQDVYGRGRVLGGWLVRHVRQSIGLYGRLTTQTDGAIDASALSSFRERVTEVVAYEPSSSVAAIGQVFALGLDLSCLWRGEGEIPFAHGPGAVAERYKPWEKCKIFCTDDDRFDWVNETFFRPLFPDDASFAGVHSYSYYAGRYGSLNLIKGERRSRVLCVPKDYRGPRVIAAEPALAMYVQKGVDGLIRRHIKRSAYRHALHLNDQTFNQQAAKRGSVLQDIATLDLSDASDRIRLSHVQEVFRRRPDVLHILEQCRTGTVAFKDEWEVDISSFATMGSALCFPIESIVLATYAINAAWNRVMGDRVGYKRSTVQECIRRMNLLVFGDDIVVRRDLVPLVMAELTRVGFVLNTAKSCYRSHFCESCGVDACWGEDVTPLRPRNLPGGSEVDLENQVATAQLFVDRGYRSAGMVVLYHACKRFRAVVPVVDTNIPHALYVKDHILPYCVVSRLKRGRGFYVLGRKRSMHNEVFDLRGLWEALASNRPNSVLEPAVNHSITRGRDGAIKATPRGYPEELPGKEQFTVKFEAPVSYCVPNADQWLHAINTWVPSTRPDSAPRS